MNLPPNFTVERPSATTTIRAEQAASDGSGFQRAIRAAAMFAVIEASEGEIRVLV